MDLEYTVQPFLLWFRSAAGRFVGVSIVLAIGVLLGGFLIASARLGPAAAVRQIFRTIRDGIHDFRLLSFRRTGAIARLTIHECTRRYVVVAFVVFLVFLLFGAWYLDSESDNPARLYLSTVLNATNLLMFVLAIFLSAFSIPNDIKSRTMYTIVTKPVRPWEIVLGRIAGFTAVCTVILALMCVSSYVFVRRGLDHQHGVDMSESEDGESVPNEGRTSRDSFHRHEYSIGDDGYGETDSRLGHVHAMQRDADGKVTIGPPVYDSLQARQAIYAPIEFRDRQGRRAAKGINVGKEWVYRGYVEGQTDSAAIWHFSDLDPHQFPEGIPLEMTIRVFRTHKGDIEKGIVGSLALFNPLFTDPAGTVDRSQITKDTAVRSRVFPIIANEFSTNSLFIPRRIRVQMEDGSERDVDIFDGLVHNGKLDIRLQCDQLGQYYGVAGPDLYVRIGNGSFAWNFAKTYYAVWMQLLIVISLGVMMSTFLNGAVAMLGTFFCVALGFFAQTIYDVAVGELEGGGPIESFVRLMRQQNQVSELEQTAATTIIKWIDVVIMYVMESASSIMPNFRGFPEYGGMSTVGFTVAGFDIPMNLVLQHSLIAFTYVGVVACLAYGFLKSREIAA